jgi:hypothetical protein
MAPLDKAVAAFYIYASVASGGFSDTVRLRTLLGAAVVFVDRGRNFRSWVRALLTCQEGKLISAAPFRGTLFESCE